MTPPERMPSPGASPSAGLPAARMLFVSPRFLFPIDSGGKIRTTQILRGLLQLGHFEVSLCAPVHGDEAVQHQAELATVCHRFASWPATEPSAGAPTFRQLLWQAKRALYLFDELPIPVRSDLSTRAQALIAVELTKDYDVVVFDFLHAAVLAPPLMRMPSVLFTHNVEAEIFARHVEVAADPVRRWVWRNQHAKMVAVEQDACSRFDTIVAVSQRDADHFTSRYGVEHTHVIPTGVDLDFFEYTESTAGREVVFCGSMDWLANRDGVEFFLNEVWGLIVAQVPDARMTVVGRAPPDDLLQRAAELGYTWAFTGFVDDVREHIQNASVSVIPLRVGGGTRLKVFEAMAVGAAIVSTALGVEGLEVVDGEHYRCADDASAMAQAVVALLLDEDAALQQIRNARAFVEESCSHINSARMFQTGCLAVMNTDTVSSPNVAPEEARRSDSPPI